MEPEEFEINEGNFDQYFKDARRHSISRGEIIAQYTASAELVDGLEKRQLISLIKDTEGKMEATAQVMRRLLFASELDSYRVPRMMAQDMISGMPEEDVLLKPYKYTLEMFFYAKPEHVPNDDPHWNIISVLNSDDFFDRKDGITSRIVGQEVSESK